MTGFSAATRALIAERSGGVCERCGQAIAVHCHHRRPRGMGGASYRQATNLPANAAHLCLEDHDWCESHREGALEEGWLVDSWNLPSTIPVLYRGEWMLLDDSGMLNPVTP